MRRAGLVVLVVLVATVVAMSVTCGVYYSKDLPRSNPVVFVVCPEDTVYAPGFRESRFREVVPGMSVAELRARLGEPLLIKEYDAQGFFIRKFDPRDPVGTERRRWPAEEGKTGPPQESAWGYSKPGKRFDSYYVRVVFVDAAGRVLRASGVFSCD